MTELTDDPADALYRDDPADFVTRRSALAKSLKAAGEAEAAARVAKLRKPPRTAAALGEFARSDPGAVQALLDAARAVAEALRAGGTELRAAQSEYSSVVSNLVERAADAGDVTSDAMRERMRATLLAAGADPDGEIARQLSVGALRDDAAAPGFAFGVVGPLAESAPAAGAAPSDEGESERPARRRLRSVRTGATSRVRTSSGDSDEAAAEDGDSDEAALLDAQLEERRRLADEQAAAEREAAERDSADREAAEREATARREAMRRRRAIERDLGRMERRASRLLEQADEAEAKAAVARLAADEAVAELEATRARLDELS